ncbi:MAG: hypothetical protein HFI34_12190 [Lachnospiraceae bacterium]|nr:hypothetical protein [Lachnospiraceae bacterium]
MAKMKLKIKNVSRIWKALAVLVISFVVFMVASKFATASTVSVSIVGDDLTDGTWEVGSGTKVWTASAYDSELDGALSLEDGGSIVWTSSDRNIVDFSSSSQGTESTVTLRPVSAGRVTITATYSKVMTSPDGDYEIRESSSRDVVVRFKLDATKLPQAPYEDDWMVPTILSNSTKPVTWTSSNEGVVTVADDGNGNGIVTLAGAGSAIVTATTEDGQSQSFPVVVNAKLKENSALITVPYKDYYTLSTNAVNPSNIVYGSANPAIVSVDTDGTARGNSAGRTTLYVYAVDENHEWYPLLPSPARSVQVKVDLQIDADSTIVAVGDTLQLSANVIPEYATGINWTSTDTSVATIDSTGLVTAVKKGTTQINATMVNKELFGTDEMHTATITINVIDSFAVSESQHIMNVGDSFDISAIVTDQSATVTWVSSDESVAKVAVSKDDKFGATITGVSKGTATITATQIIDGVAKYATCEVSVKEPVVNVEISPAQIEIIRGSKYPLVIEFTPFRPDNMNVTWVSSDTSIVTVDDKGVITGVKGGQAAVSVISEDGIKVASCTVTVREPVTSIKLDVHRVTTSLLTGTYQLTYTIEPKGEGVNRDVTWTSSAPDVATVGENGLVTFLKPGKATIVVKTVDAGISGNLIDTCEFYINNPVTSVDLDYTDITLKMGEEFRLTALVLPEDASDKTVLWSSSDTNVATVNENGMVTAVNSGSATILCKSADSGETSMCNVTVYQPVTGVTISNESMTVRKGQEFWLNATCQPENAMNKLIIWSSSDTSIATVDKNGKVTAVEPGDCVITATSQDSGVTARCSLTVTQPITGIFLNTNAKTILAGEKFVIIPTIEPLDADNKNVTYTSSDTSVATVDSDGIVTGVRGGKTVIIVKTEERGLIASCLVTVQEFVSSVNIIQDSAQMNLGAVLQLQAEVLNETATNRKLTWSSTNNGIIQVDSTGKVTAVGMGTATIYAYATDGSGLYDTCQITVIKPVGSIVVQPSSVTVSEGKTAKVTATVYPADASIQDIEWSSSDPSVATVDYNGEITGITKGICKIFATSSDGNNIVGVCRVTVKETVPATGITINSKNITMLPGQTRGLSARIKPARSTEGIYWVSGDTSVATVSADGVVTARGQGMTEIYCISDETGVESSCEVIVLAMNATFITLGQYDTFDLDVFGSTERIRWYSNNKRVATVTATGQVVARMPGTTTITAKVNGKILYCTVTVTTIY